MTESYGPPTLQPRAEEPVGLPDRGSRASVSPWPYPSRSVTEPPSHAGRLHDTFAQHGSPSARFRLPGPFQRFRAALTTPEQLRG
jgi:hypothetical protein